ncbi:MAG: hypothetical protein NVS4B3_04390 [Gemmatimonadaceae bacterium]
MPVRPVALRAVPPIVRGLYVNRFAAQSPRRMAKLVGWADSTEINALVIDVKDEFGLNYVSKDADVMKNAGVHGHIGDLRRLLDTLKAHKIYAIARVVTFKDPVAATANSGRVIRKPDGSPWTDKTGTTWVNPYDRSIWQYNIRIAEELTRLGFDEIQFDYIRFPEPYKSLAPQVFPGAKGEPKPDILAEFLRTACARVHSLGGHCAADVFGLVTTVPGALEVGQSWEKLAPAVDVLLPMTYPSHYPHGSFGLARPNAEPYKVQLLAISKARERSRRMGMAPGEQVRPWIQAFTLGAPAYGPEEIRQQKQGIYDAGYDGWVMWHPGSKYEPFLPALEPTRVSRKKTVAALPTARRDTTAAATQTKAGPP